MNSDSPNTADIVERLNDQLVETQMLAYKWMEAHDKLAAGKPYDLPKPADLPDALAEITELREALAPFARIANRCAGEPDETVLYVHQGIMGDMPLTIGDFRRAALKDHRKAQAHD